MRTIVWERDDGGISITRLISGDPETEAARLVENGSVPASWRTVGFDVEDLPEGRDLREAWRCSAGKVVVDLDAAKEVTKARIRSEREAPLARLDAEYMKALEQSADTAAIIAEKQRLRDLPAAADLCGDIDSLRALKV